MTSHLVKWPWMMMLCIALVSLPFGNAQKFQAVDVVRDYIEEKYWVEKLPSTEMPATVRNHISALSPEQVGKYKDLITTGKLLSDPIAASEFCSSADLLCRSLDGLFPSQATSSDSRELRPIPGDARLLRSHFYYYQNAVLAVHDPGLVQDMSGSSDSSSDLKVPVEDPERGSWFLEKDLITNPSLIGNPEAAQPFRVPASQLYTNASLQQATRRSFLPRDLAQLLGMDVSNALHQLHIPEESTTGEVMRETAAICAASNSSEVASACALSVEDLADYVAATLLQKEGSGSSIEALGSTGIPGPSYELVRGTWFKVVKVERKGDEKSMYLSCHYLLFPFLVTLCHHIPDTRVYYVTLESTAVAGHGYRIGNVVLCHMDTSKWNPEHAAFKVLGTSPGHSEACHWSSQDEFAFVQVVR